jgi:stage II sporulation protein D
MSNRAFLRVSFVTASLLFLSSCGGTRHLEEGAVRSPVVRVCIADPPDGIDLALQAGAIIETGRTRYTVKDSTLLRCQRRDNGRLDVRAGSNPIGDADDHIRCWYKDDAGYFSLAGRRYADTLTIMTDGTRLYVINALPLERYLRGVVANEIGAGRTEDEFEAVKAQAILARTYALAKLALPLTRLFDVRGDTRDQVFTGIDGQTALATRAIQRTMGQALSFEGTWAEVYYHGTCGGSTEAASLLWKRPQSKPYLAGIRDAGRHGTFCAISPNFRWTETYTRDELEAIFRSSLPSANDSIAPSTLPASQWHLLDLRILSRLPSGRVGRLEVVMGSRSRQWTYAFDADRVRWALRRPDGNAILRSGLIDLLITRDENRWMTAVSIQGGGSGHGIGLCQWGAIGRAKKGFLAEEILQAYFPGTTVVGAY